MHKGWQKAAGIIILLAEVAIVPFAIFFMLSQHLGSKSLVRIISMSMTLGSICLCIIASYCCITENRHYPNRSLLFELMCFMCSLALFVDLISLSLDSARMPGLSMLVNTIYYLVGINIALAFFIYEFALLDILKGPRYSLCRRIVYALALLGNLATLLNIKFGFFFLIERTGFYHRAPTYLFSFIAPVTIIVISIIVALKERSDTLQKKTLSQFWTVPILTTVLQIFIQELSIQYSGYTIALIFLYINVHSELDSFYIHSLPVQED